MEIFRGYEPLLDKALSYYCKDEDYIKYFGRIPKTRAYTFRHCLEYIHSLNRPACVVELGTCRSFVDGRFPGCNSSDPSYWKPGNPEIWDWSAGHFTGVFSECTPDNTVVHTVDLEASHIQRCKIMTATQSKKITYYVCSSEEFINRCPPESIDLLYLDTGDVNPVEPTALLHLREAKLIVKNNILKDNGIILIDDVKNLASKMDAGEASDHGKAKYSIPFLLQNGYEIVLDEYQVVLKKKKVYRDIYDFLKERTDIGPTDSVVECGGHTGTDTKKLCTLFGKNQVHSVEANKLLYDTLHLLRSEFPNLSVYNLGLSNRDETIQFFIDTDPNGDAGASSFLKANEREALSHLSKIERPVDVECVTIKTFMSRADIHNIYLLWLDVEQHEYEILNACSRQVLSRIKYIYTEVNFREFRKGGKLYADILKLMNRNNFNEIMKTPQGSKQYDWQANVLFENRMYGKTTKLRILHISHHVGCMRDHAYIYDRLGADYEFWKFTKGLFRITASVANTIWREKKDYFNSFDYIVTSDTAPLSRIFMENISELTPKVVVWICNRFDYNVESDISYYTKFNEIAKHHADTFKIIPYSDFEGVWCRNKGITGVLPTITPIGINKDELDYKIDGLQVLKDSYVHDSNSKEEYSNPSELDGKVFIPIYQNDNLFYRLSDIFAKNSIPYFNGGYRNTSDLKHCKAMVTFPDAYSKLIAFETIQNEVIVFLPSEEFLIALHPTTNNGRAYWFNCPLGHLNKETIKLCEWYRYTNCRVYFDSIDDLVLKIGELTPEVVDEKKKWCRIYASEIEKKNMQMWSDIFEPDGSPAI